MSSVTLQSRLNGRIALVGKTYPYKESIKTIPGAFYHREAKEWTVPVSQQQAASAIYVLAQSKAASKPSKQWRLVLLCECTDSTTCQACTYACCDRAEILPCFCRFSYKCPKHTFGEPKCVGSHD